jgi:flagellar motor switch protein FliG
MATINTQVPLTGVRKAAVLALMLGEEVSTEIFKHLREDEIEHIASEMAGMGVVNPEQSERVLDEFHQMALARNYMATGGVDLAKNLLTNSLSPEAAQRIIERVTRSFESTLGFTALEKSDPQQLSKFILSEHPQTIALILAHLQSARRHPAHLVGDRAAPQEPRRRPPRVVRRRPGGGGAAEPARAHGQPTRARHHRVGPARPRRVHPEPHVRL